MPNAFLQPGRIAAAALGVLRAEIVLPRLVTRLGVDDFRGAINDTITLRVPTLLTARDYEWRTRNDPIVLDVLEELAVPVTLDKHVYSAIAVTDEELTLDIVDFTAQVLIPQMRAVADKLEALIAETMAGATFAAQDVQYAEGTDDGFYRALVDARKALNDANVPLSGRVALIGSGVEAAGLKEASIRAADQSGSTDALRNATLGQVAGFTIVQSNAVAEDFAIAFHRTAFAFANVAPAVPAGAPFGATREDGGLAMRWLRDYDAAYLRDRSIASAFAGSASVNDGRDGGSGSGANDLNDTNVRAVKIAFTASS
jgi:hypothetical protein